MSIKTRRILFGAVLILSLLISLFVPVDYSQAADPPPPPTNLGFEQDLSVGWQTITPLANVAIRVGTEYATGYPTYTSMGISSVSPTKGNWMLRLGSPKSLSESQNRGTTAVKQTFTATGSTLKLAFRLFSWEFRNYDKLRIELVDSTGKNDFPVVNDKDGTPGIAIAMPDGTTSVNYKTPISVTPTVGKRGNYLAPKEWAKYRITGLTPGRIYTLTYAIDSTNNEAHATWAYFDNINTPPVAAVQLNSSSPKTNDTLTATATRFDIDSDPVALTFVWKKNGVATKITANSGGLTDTYDLSLPGNGDKGNIISVEVTPYDGFENGAMAAASATVINTPPVATVLLNSSSPKTNDTLTATVTKSDVDNDHVALTFVWKKNGVVTKTTANSGGLTDTYNLSLPGNGDKGNTISVEVTPNDGSESGSITSASATVINTPPVATVQLNSSSPRTNDTLTATATRSDADNDPVTLTFVWKKNGVATKTTDNSSSLTDTYDLRVTGNGDKGNIISVEVTPYDGFENGTTAAASATVINTPPVATVQLNSSSPKTNDTLTATATTSDDDNDPVTLTFVWKKNAAVTKTTANSPALTDTYDLNVPGNGNKRDNITVQVTPNDGSENGAVTSASATVVNSPPVANFSLATSQNTTSFEGASVHLNNTSYDIDSADPPPGDSITSWKWNISGPNVTSWTSNMQNPSFLPPQNGSYTVSLTVADSDNASTTITSGGVPALGMAVAPALVVHNFPPLVNALNVEVRSGSNVPLFGRFEDHGWLDKHTAVWQLGSLTKPGTVREKNKPIVDYGIVTGNFTAAEIANAISLLSPPVQLPVQLLATLKVTDTDGMSHKNNFWITVLPSTDNLSSRELNNDLASPPVLTSDSVYISYIQTDGDIDVFEIKQPGSRSDRPPLPGYSPLNAQSLPVGARVVATLKGLPADYDLVLVTMLPVDNTTFQRAAWDEGAWDEGAWDEGAWDEGAWDEGAWDEGAWDEGAWDEGAWDEGAWNEGAWDEGAWNEGAWDEGAWDEGAWDEGAWDEGAWDEGAWDEGGQIGSGDIKLGELSLGGILNANTKVVGFSANRGLTHETLQAKIDAPGTRLFVIVRGSNGARSGNSYGLRVELSVPVVKKQSGSILVSPQTPQTVLHEEQNPKTLFITQQDRLKALYGTDSWNTLETKLIALAGHPSVKGDIISLSSGIYDAWDENPSIVEEANKVAVNIRTEVQNYLGAHPTIEYVVLIGSDDIIPYRRVPGETVIGNERYYLRSAFLKLSSPLRYSIQGGFNLTDDYYVDAQPSAIRGRELYIPDLAIGRLIETPQEMGAIADAFMNGGSVLNPTTGFASGYDFFADGSNSVMETLRNAGLTSVNGLIRDTWTADELRNGILFNSPPPDISIVNAHFTHYAALSASGFNSVPIVKDLLSSLDVVNTNARSLIGRILFTMGCHAGLNVPDRGSQAVDPGLGVNPALDFPQAMAQQRSIYVASTGFGLGETEGMAGTELLLSMFAKELVKGDVTVGKALMASKRDYLSSLNPATVYDEKSSIQTTLYGLPMYRVQITGATPAVQSGNNLMTITDGSSTNSVYYSLKPTTNANGTYYSANYNTTSGEVQATSGRVIQPRIVYPFESLVTNPVHGFLLTSGNFSDITGSDPVISMPTNEWVRNLTEPKTLPPSFWPSELANVNSLEKPGGKLDQKLVVIPGQFKPTGFDPANNLIGIERLYHSLSFELLRSTLSDWQSPVINGVDFRALNDTTVAVSVNANDSSGIARIVVLRISNGSFTSTSLILNPPANGMFSLNVPFANGDTLLVQVVDAAGNIASSTGKGANMSVVQVNAAPTAVVNENASVTLQATLPDFNKLITPVFYTWDFGDGTSTSGITTNSIITVQHIYPDDNPTGTPSDNYTTMVKVTDSGGGIGTAFTTVTVLDVAPQVTFAVTSPVDENGTSTATGSFTDVSLLDTHTGRINWGDGTVVTLSIVQGAGGGTFTVSHTYLDDNPTGTSSDNYTVTMTVTDDDTLFGNAASEVLVNNVPPAVEAGADRTANEGDIVSLNPVQVNDSGRLDTHIATINWGDGFTSAGAVSESNGSGTATGNHQYSDNGTYTVAVSIFDDDLSVSSDTLKMTINNVAPTATFNAPSPVNEGSSITISLTSPYDPSSADTAAGFTYAFDLGLGTGYGAFSSTNSATVVPPDGPKTLAVKGKIQDKDGGITEYTASVTVTNVAPTVVTINVSEDVPGNTLVNIAANFTDPGILDTHTAVWNWGDNTTSAGVVIETNGNGGVAGNHTYTTLGTFTVMLTVTDNDGGVGQSTRSVNVGMWDPQGDVASQNDGHLADADFIGGFITNNSATMTIGLRVAGRITENYQYRIRLDLNGSGFLLKYNGGKVTGLPSLKGTIVNGNELQFTFNLNDIGKSSGDYIKLSAQTQAGVPATPEAGIVDNMPDAGVFGYVVR